jgi:hypothetical protein
MIVVAEKSGEVISCSRCMRCSRTAETRGNRTACKRIVNKADTEDGNNKMDRISAIAAWKVSGSRMLCPI